MSSPKARTILFNGAVKKGERLVPPSALELLMRLTFPVPSARVKVGVLVLHFLLDFGEYFRSEVKFWLLFFFLRQPRDLKLFIQP